MLQKALLYQRKSSRLKISDDEVEVAVAWIKEEVSLAGVVAAFGMSHCKTYTRLAYAVRRAFNEGKLKS